MCTVSMIGDHYKEWLPQKYPATFPNLTIITDYVPRHEFDALKRDVEQMKELLTRAKEYDERTGQRDCEIEEKMDFLRRAAKLVGVNLDEVIGPQKGDA